MCALAYRITVAIGISLILDEINMEDECRAPRPLLIWQSLDISHQFHALRNLRLANGV